MGNIAEGSYDSSIAGSSSSSVKSPASELSPMQKKLAQLDTIPTVKKESEELVALQRLVDASEILQKKSEEKCSELTEQLVTQRNHAGQLIGNLDQKERDLSKAETKLGELGAELADTKRQLAEANKRVQDLNSHTLFLESESQMHHEKHEANERHLDSKKDLEERLATAERDRDMATHQLGQQLDNAKIEIEKLQDALKEARKRDAKLTGEEASLEVPHTHASTHPHTQLLLHPFFVLTIQFQTNFFCDMFASIIGLLLRTVFNSGPS